jgi:hypothetical protein
MLREQLADALGLGFSRGGQVALRPAVVEPELGWVSDAGVCGRVAHQEHVTARAQSRPQGGISFGRLRRECGGEQQGG